MKKIKILLIFIFILEIGYFVYAETNNIVINTQEIQDKNLWDILGDVSIMQISDLHIEKIGVKEKRLVKLIKQINPEIIFITGDFVSNDKGINPCIEVLRNFVPGRIVIAILGNNDHSYKKKAIDTDLLQRELKKTGIKILRNESLKLTIQRKELGIKHSLYVVGLDDNYLWFDDIFKAMDNVPKDSPRILLAHSPNIIEKINTQGINLIISGHTHGGQIALPFIGALYTNPVCNAKKRFISGLYNEGVKLYVNRGIGTAEIPLRLFSKPEVTLFKFVCGKG